MSGHTHDNMVPPIALKAAASLVIMSLALVSGVKLGLVQGSLPASQQRAAAQISPAAERLLVFTDRADGHVVVTDAATGAMVRDLGREGSGFVRGVMRGLARERRLHGAGNEAPFRLALWPDRALSLTDTVTGRVIELNGFGPTNRAAFAQFLTDGSTS